MPLAKPNLHGSPARPELRGYRRRRGLKQLPASRALQGQGWRAVAAAVRPQASLDRKEKRESAGPAKLKEEGRPSTRHRPPGGGPPTLPSKTAGTARPSTGAAGGSRLQLDGGEEACGAARTRGAKLGARPEGLQPCFARPPRAPTGGRYEVGHGTQRARTCRWRRVGETLRPSRPGPTAPRAGESRWTGGGVNAARPRCAKAGPAEPGRGRAARTSRSSSGRSRRRLDHAGGEGADGGTGWSGWWVGGRGGEEGDGAGPAGREAGGAGDGAGAGADAARRESPPRRAPREGGGGGGGGTGTPKKPRKSGMHASEGGPLHAGQRRRASARMAASASPSLAARRWGTSAASASSARQWRWTKC